MKKIKSISLTPEILGPVNKEGCEEIFQLVQGSIIIYEDDSVSKGNIVSTKYFRQVDESFAEKEGVVKFTNLNPDTFDFDIKYLQPIKAVSPDDRFNEIINKHKKEKVAT